MSDTIIQECECCKTGDDCINGLCTLCLEYNCDLLKQRNNLLDVCEEAETAILDAIHAGNLSRSYAGNVIWKIEHAIAAAKGGE